MGTPLLGKSISDMKSFGIYQIELNGKKYIGSTSVSFSDRWYQHVNQLKRGKHDNRYLQNAFNKYGEEFLFLSVLETIDDVSLVAHMEQKYINEIKPEYNICPVVGSQLGVKRTEDWIKKHRELNLGKVMSIESRRKMSEAKKGRRHTKEQNQKMSEIMKGRLFTEEWRKKISESAKGNKKGCGHIVSEAQKQKIRESKIGNKIWLGRTHTEETRRRLSEINKGNKNCLGRKVVISDEQKKKISESLKRYYANKRSNDNDINFRQDSSNHTANVLLFT